MGYWKGSLADGWCFDDFVTWGSLPEAERARTPNVSPNWKERIAREQARVARQQAEKEAREAYDVAFRARRAASAAREQAEKEKRKS